MSRHPNVGHKNLGEFAQAVYRASPGLHPQAAATTVSTEDSGGEGGFLIPPNFLAAVNLADSRKSILAYCSQATTTSGGAVVPVNQTPPWSASGVSLTPTPEGVAITQSKPSIETRVVTLQNLRILLPVTSELLDDAPGLDAYLRLQFQEKAQFQIENWLINGDGIEKPLGLMNSPALLTQTKESGQSAGTVVFANAFKMYNKLYSAAKHRAVWLMHPTVTLALQQATDANSGSLPLEYGWAADDDTAIGAQGASAPVTSPADGNMKLLGCPVIESEACQVVGTPGDIIFADLKNVLCLMKPTGSRVDISPYLWFDQDLQAFRFTLRLGLIPMWSAAQTEYHGSNKVSIAVALAAR